MILFNGYYTSRIIINQVLKAPTGYKLAYYRCLLPLLECEYGRARRENHPARAIIPFIYVGALEIHVGGFLRAGF